MGHPLVYLRLVRPGNALLAAVGVLVGATGALGVDAPLAPILLAAMGAILGVAGGNALNDALDAPIDGTAHPERPIPRGEVRVQDAKRLGAGLILLGFLLVASVNAGTLVLGALLAGNLVLYEFHSKARGLLGHVLVSYNAGALFLLGGLSALAGPFDYRNLPLDGRLLAPLAMATLALLLNLARELYKSAEDAAHDRGRRETFAVRAGPQRARRLASGVSWATIPLALVPAALGVFDRLYVWLLLPLLVLLVAVPFVGTSRKAQQLLKFGMLLGFVPFLVPKLI